MPRSMRSRQVEFEPGTSDVVDGNYTDDNGATVTITVEVRSCEEPGDRSVTVDKAEEGTWAVVLSPDAVTDLDGLVGEDEIPVRLTIVARPCTQNDEEPVEPIEQGPDLVADMFTGDIVAPIVHPDIAAPAPPRDF